MAIVVKKVAGFKYHWNNLDKRWEGLRFNSTQMEIETAVEVMQVQKKIDPDAKFQIIDYGQVPRDTQLFA